MGVGPHAIRLVKAMLDFGAVSEGFSVVELGSQDFAPDYETVHQCIGSNFSLENYEKMVSPADLYALAGASKYLCIDLDGHHSALKFDLNVDLKAQYGFTERFDLVTNHGTTEHLFDQAVAFRNIHGLTAHNGIMLHIVPFQGYQNHGMVNYSATFFVDIAAANNYEVLGIFACRGLDLFPYDEDFLLNERVTAIEDIALAVVLRKDGSDAFRRPYDGRYFTNTTRDEIAFNNEIKPTSRMNSWHFPLNKFIGQPSFG